MSWTEKKLLRLTKGSHLIANQPEHEHLATEGDSAVEMTGLHKSKEYDFRPKDLLPSNGGYKDDSRPKPAQQVNFMPILGNKNKVSIVDQSFSPQRKVKVDNSIRPR